MYLRKSRADIQDEARGQAETLARHKAALMDNARRLGRVISEIYAEVVSGDSIAARPEMQRLMADVEAGKYEAVHVMEVERLARGDSLDQGLVARVFKYSGTKIITPLKIYDPEDEFDEEYFEFSLYMSRRELKTITRRQQRGRVASVMEGKWPANKAPYGYRRVKLAGQKGWTLEPAEGEADVVRDVFRWYTQGFAEPDGSAKRLGVSRIVRRLNDAGVKTLTGRDWTNAVVRDLLRNPAYAGWVRWGHRPAVKRVVDGRVVISSPRAAPEDIRMAKGLHPPLVSQETFDRAQELLARNKSRPGPRQVEMKNPLSGLVICGGCGRAMVRRPYGDGREAGLICQYTSCPTVSSTLSTVESSLLDALRRWYAELSAGRKEDAPAASDALRLAEARVDTLDKTLARLRTQLDKAHELVEQGVYSADVFLARSRALAAQIEDAERQRAQAAQDASDARQAAEAWQDTLPRLRHVLDAYGPAQSPEERNALLRSVLDHVVYTKTRRERWTGGSDMQLTLFPRIPYAQRQVCNKTDSKK